MGNKTAMTKTAHHLDLAIADPLGIITLANPPLNFLSVELLAEIADAVEACDADPRVRVIVLRAQGKTFCAGADLVGGAAGESGADGLAAIRRLYDQALRLFRRRKPMVAAVGGAAVGAGLGLALSADFRVATPAARFSANFVALGFHPGFAISHTLPRVIGAQRAAWMMLSAERVKGAQALDWGLVDRLVEADDLDTAAQAMAREMAANGPLALVAVRGTMVRGLADAVAAALDRELAEQAILRETADYAEGVAAVFERRPARFTGR